MGNLERAIDLAEVRQPTRETAVSNVVSRNDPAIVNLPLSKRGNIDAQLDSYKAQQSASARSDAEAKAAETRRLRAEAKRLVDTSTDEQLASLAARAGKSVARVRAYLRSEAHWNPALVITYLQKTEGKDSE